MAYEMSKSFKNLYTYDITNIDQSILIQSAAFRCIHVLTITASEQRSQFANRKAARQRLAALLRSSLAPLPQRRASKPTRASKLQRLRDKRIRSELKAQRRRPLAD